MKNYVFEVEKLSEELNQKIIEAYDAVVTKHGELQVQMGAHPPQTGCFEIKLNIKMRIEQFFTKVNGVGYDINHIGNKREFFVKGFQVARLRYRMKPIKNMSIDERQEVLNHIIKRYSL